MPDPTGSGKSSAGFPWGTCLTLRLDCHRGADLDLLIDQRRDLCGETAAAVRGGVAGEDAHVHPDARIGEPAEPFHGSTEVARARGSGIGARTDATTDRAA